MTREDIEKKMHESAEEIKPLVTTLVEALCEAHQKGYLAGVELGAKMAYPQWIPVEEELPKKDGKYLFYDEVLGHEVSIYYDGVTLVPSITHWMPLPEAPQGKEDEI